MPAPVPPQAVHDEERKHWAGVAKGWGKHSAWMAKTSAPVTERMLDLAQIGEGSNVLDVACGAGEPALSAALRVGKTGRVVAVDLSAEMLAQARQAAERRGLGNVEFRCTPGERVDELDGPFDAVTCRWGLMFIPEPATFLQKAHALLRAKKRVCLACWQKPERVPFTSLLKQLTGKYITLPELPEDAPSMFRFADPDRLRSLLTRAGFARVELDSVRFDFIQVKTAQDYVAIMRDLSPSLRDALARLDPSKHRALFDDAKKAVEAYRVGDEIRVGGTTWIAWGEK